MGESVFSLFKPFAYVMTGLLGRPGFTRRIITRGLHKRGITGYFSTYFVPPLLLSEFDLVQRVDIYAPGAFPGLPTPFDVASELGISYRKWDWQTDELENRAHLAAAIKEGRDQFLFHYSPRFDGVMHTYGTRSEETLAALRDNEAFTREMFKLASQNYDEVRLFVFGDHGMADKIGEVDLLTPVLESGFKAPKDFLYFVDSTMARFWFNRPETRDRVVSMLNSLPGGRILTDEECAHLGVLYDDRCYGELCWLADPGMIIVPSFMGQTAPLAMHGYHPDDLDGDTILLSNVEHGPVQSIRDIGPLLCSELRALID